MIENEAHTSPIVTNITNETSTESPGVVMSNSEAGVKSVGGGTSTPKREQGQLRALLAGMAYMNMLSGATMNNEAQAKNMFNSVSNRAETLVNSGYVMSIDGIDVDLNPYANKLQVLLNSTPLPNVLMKSNLSLSSHTLVTGNSFYN
jgi:hypothetical protein